MNGSSEEIGRIPIMCLGLRTLICKWSKPRGRLRHHWRYLMMNKIWKRRTTTKGYLCHRTGKGKQVLGGQEEQADKTSVKNRIEYKAVTPDHSLGLNVTYLSHYSQTEYLTITPEHYSYLV